MNQGAHPGSYNGQDAYSDLLVTEREREMDESDRERTSASTVPSGESGGVELHGRSAESTGVYRARRLTPTECARLQGFPPDWCSDVPHSDSAEYKLWGNGIGLPCIIPMMDAMGKEIRKEEK